MILVEGNFVDLWSSKEPDDIIKKENHTWNYIVNSISNSFKANLASFCSSNKKKQASYNDMKRLRTSLQLHLLKAAFNVFGSNPLPGGACQILLLLQQT